MNDFLNDLTLSQKKAMVYAFYQIAKSDNELAEDEITFLQKIGDKLGETFGHLSISQLIVTNTTEHIKHLKSLNSNQKNWFVINALAVINADKRLYDEEFSVANGFFAIIGYTPEKVNLMIDSLNSSKLKFY